MSSDPIFRLELEYCVEHGIPHSRFLSWPEEDQDKAVEFLLWSGRRCQRCGSHPEEWLDEEGRTAEPPPYLVETRKCYGCVTLEEAQKDISRDDSNTIVPYLTRNRSRKIPDLWQKRLSQSNSRATADPS